MRSLGKGKVVVHEDLETLLGLAGIAREPLVDHGLQFIRRKSPSHVTYFIANHSADPLNAWLAIASPCRSAVLLDPMTARAGVAPIRFKADRAEVYLQMQSGETRVLRAFSDKSIDGPAWPIGEPSGEPVTVDGPWRVKFVEGGPVLPDDIATDELACWTELGGEETKAVCRCCAIHGQRERAGQERGKMVS